MRIKERAYQTHAVLKIKQAMQKPNKGILYVLPTGGGKTVVASLLIKELLQENKTILFLTHRRELLSQAQEQFTELFPDTQLSFFAPGKQYIEGSPLHIGSIQYLFYHKKSKIPEGFVPDVIFIDEAHHIRAYGWEWIMDKFPNAQRIGLTATPVRLDGKSLSSFFSVMIEGPSILDLIQMKYLPKIETYSIDKLTTLKWHYQKTRVQIAHAIDAYQTCAPNTRAIFFAWSIAHSKKIARAFQRAGVPAEHIDAKTYVIDRDRILRGLQTRKA